MSRTVAAAAPGLPMLRSTALPELEGTALRLHVAPVVAAIWSDGPRGYALLSLCPSDDPDEPAALVRLPLAQAEVLERATAAFNCIMAAAESTTPAKAQEVVSAASSDGGTGFFHSSSTTPPLPHSPQPVAPRAQALVTAAAQVAIFAGLLPAVAARCLGLI